MLQLINLKLTFGNNSIPKTVKKYKCKASKVRTETISGIVFHIALSVFFSIVVFCARK